MPGCRHLPRSLCSGWLLTVWTVVVTRSLSSAWAVSWGVSDNFQRHRAELEREFLVREVFTVRQSLQTWIEDLFLQRVGSTPSPEVHCSFREEFGVHRSPLLSGLPGEGDSTAVPHSLAGAHMEVQLRASHSVAEGVGMITCLIKLI